MPSDFAALVQRQLWAMEPSKLEAFALLAAGPHRPDGAAAAAEEHARAGKKPPPYELADGVAIIPLAGDIIQDPDLQSLYRWYGLAFTDPVAFAEAVRLAARDVRARSILVSVSSPGGIISGVQMAGDAVWEARQSSGKPVHAYVTDLCASAAYWIASQAGRISADSTALVGSIGVYTVLYDLSGLAEKAGIKVRVVSSGPHKGTGVPGAPITDAQVEPIKERIEDLAALFRGAVARGRGLAAERVQESASGAAWVAAKAQTRGLIDAVATPEQAIQACSDDEERRRQAAAASAVAAAAAAAAAQDPQPKTQNPELPSGGQSAGAVAGGSREPSPEKERDMGEGKEQAAGAAISTAGPSREEIVKAERERMSALKAAFPKDPAFALECFEKGLDLAGAKALAFDRAEAKTKAGTSAVAHGNADEAEERQAAATAAAEAAAADDAKKSAWERLDAKIVAHMKEHKGSRREATSAVIRENPDLHAEFLDEQHARAERAKSPRR